MFRLLRLKPPNGGDPGAEDAQLNSVYKPTAVRVRNAEVGAMTNYSDLRAKPLYVYPRCAVVVFIMMAALLSWSAFAAIYYSDDQVQVPRTGAYAPIGIVVPSERGKDAGTGFLVDACHVLTTQHIETTRPEMPTAPVKKFFFFGVGPYMGFEKPVAGFVVAQGGYDDRYDARSKDWMLIRLNECVGMRIGYLKIAPIKIARLYKVDLKMAGYPDSRHHARGVWMDPSCTVKGARANYWLHDCASDKGSSGAPLFYLTHDATGPVLNVVALHQAGVHGTLKKAWDADSSNIAVRMDRVYESIAQIIKP